MVMFGLGGKDALGPKARIQRGNGDPVAEALHGAARRRDWEEVRATLGRFEGDDRTALAWSLAWNRPGAYRWLRKEPGLDQDDAVARMLLGTAAVAHGWAVRSSRPAQNVSGRQFKRFHDHLREAERHLYAAAELDPGWSGPWVLLLTSGRGLQVGREEITRRFEAATARTPADRIAHGQMLQALCQKWGGSHDRMHEFADQARRGPHAADLAHLTARAHHEHGLAWQAERRAYLAKPDVRDELVEAAELSIFRPGYAVARAPYYDANLFAMVFSLAGMRAEARRAFELTEGVVVSAVWETMYLYVVDRHSSPQSRARSAYTRSRRRAARAAK
jgi:hypothetical protein